MRTGRLVNIDFALVLCTLAATVVGVLMVYSATEVSRDGSLGLDDFAVKQATYGAIGFVLMIVLSRVDYRFLESFTLPFYFVVLGLLGLVGVLGVITYGSQRWLNLGLFPIQPSELAKLAVIVMLAKVLADHVQQRAKLKWFIVCGIVAGVPALIVFRQPDLGTAIMLGAIFLGICAGARIPGRFFATIAVLAGPGIWGFWHFVMHDYQQERFLIFLHPESDPSGAGYNIIQARITIGSGGWLGQGYMGGSQSQLGFQKVQYSDFIFSVVAEQFGLLGSIALIALLFIVVWRCLVVASKAPDEFGSLIAAKPSGSAGLRL